MTTLTEQGQVWVEQVLRQFSISKAELIHVTWEIDHVRGGRFVNVEHVDSNRIHHEARFVLTRNDGDERWAIETETLQPL